MRLLLPIAGVLLIYCVLDATAQYRNRYQTSAPQFVRGNQRVPSYRSTTRRPTPGRVATRRPIGRTTTRYQPARTTRRPIQPIVTPGRPTQGRPPVQGRCTQNGYFPHERNCDMYYQCINGTLHEGLCPDGLVYDDKQPSDVLRCDLPFDIDCSYRQALQPPLSTEHCPRLYGLYAHETDCSRFWKCVEGHAYAFDCPEGLAYNEYNAHCDWPDQVENCDSEALLRFKCPQPTDLELQYFGDPQYPYSGDCRKHYVCVLMPDGSRKPRLLACDPGLVFNPQTSTCDDPQNVSGCQGYYNNLDAARLRELFGK